MSRSRNIFCAAVTFAASATPALLAGATLTVSAGGTYSTISAAVGAAAPGDTVLVEDGLYNEAVTVNKALTIRAAGSGAIVQPNAGNNAGVFRITAGNGVTIEGFQIVVALPNAFTGVLARASQATVDNITVRNCTITRTGTAGTPPPSNTLPFNNTAGANAGIVITNLNESTAATSVTLQGNTIGSAASPFRSMGIILDYCKGTVGGPEPGQGNTVCCEDMDISTRFTYLGDLVIEGNTFLGWGDEVNRSAQMDIGNPKVNGRVLVQNNTFSPQSGPSPNGKVHRRNLQVKNYSSVGSDVLITSNTFTVLKKGILLNNAIRANISGNTFTAGADEALLIEINNKNYSSSEATQLATGGLATNTPVVQGNTFSAGGHSGVTALEFRDHTQGNTVAGAGPICFAGVTLGGAGSLANSFEQGLSSFLSLDANSGLTNAGQGLVLYPDAANGGFNSATTMEPFTHDLLASENRFDAGNGLKRPSEMTPEERAILDGKITDWNDDPALGRIGLTPDPVVIAAVSTAGSDADPDKDYILLANQTGAAVDLTGYELRSRSGADASDTTVALAGILPPHGHFLIASAACGSDVEGAGAPNQSVPGALLGGLDHSTSFSLSLHSGTGDGAPEIDGFSFGKGAQGTNSPGCLGEGAPYPFTVADPAVWTFVRRRTGTGNGLYVDTNSNYDDLTVVNSKTPAVSTFTPVSVSGFALE